MSFRRNSVKGRAVVIGAAVAACVGLAPRIVSGQVLFSDNFDAGTSRVRYDVYSVDNESGSSVFYTDSGVGTPVLGDTSANFTFDYGAYTYAYTDGLGSPATALIPSAPRSTGGSTIGVRLDVNNTATGTGIINLYPKLAEYAGGNLPTGDQKLTFDMWMNYNGAFEGGGGSTEWFVAGINQQGGGIGGPVVGTGPFPARTGYAMAVNGERGNGADYRMYRGNTRFAGPNQPMPIVEAGYVATVDGTFGVDNGENTFYQTLFPFDNGNGHETPGSVGKKWVTVEISYVDGIVYYEINGTLIAARTDSTATAGHLEMGYADFNNTSAATEPTTGGIDANFGIFDNVELEQVTQVRPTGNLVGGGAWETATAGNWVNGVPEGVAATADFTGSITGPATVTVEASGKTVRSLVFDNAANSYTIAGGTITIDSLTTGILGTAVVKSGSHTISAPVVMNKALIVNAAASSTLTISGDVTTNGLGITKVGLGTLAVKNLRTTGAVTVSAGTVRVLNNGTDVGTSNIETLAIAGATDAWTAKLDLGDNDLVTRTAFATVLNQLKSGRAGGAWNGNGIATSAGGATHALGVLDNAVAGLATFSGQTVGATDVLVKYTYNGDANLDGQVDINDLASLATNWQLSGVWGQGDFDYSGLVDINDLAALATNWQAGVGAPLGMSFEQALAAVGLGAVSVPEPALLSLVAIIPLAARRRRR